MGRTDSLPDGDVILHFDKTIYAGDRIIHHTLLGLMVMRLPQRSKAGCRVTPFVSPVPFVNTLLVSYSCRSLMFVSSVLFELLRTIEFSYAHVADIF